MVTRWQKYCLSKQDTRLVCLPLFLLLPCHIHLSKLFPHLNPLLWRANRTPKEQQQVPQWCNESPVRLARVWKIMPDNAIESKQEIKMCVMTSYSGLPKNLQASHQAFQKNETVVCRQTILAAG